MSFLKELFEYKPENYNILIWTLPDKKSYWFSDTNVAEQIVNNISNDKDVYVGCGLVSQHFITQLDNPEYRRCPQDKIAGIPGLWVDIDVKGEGHEKENLPPDKESALELISEIPVEPSYIIDSGHGYQCWWLFKEPWLFDGEEERAEAKDLVKDWIYTIRNIARNEGWDVDATIDLSRVLRVPGTFNNKGAQVPVKVVSPSEDDCEPNRYNLERFEEYLIDTSEVEIDCVEDGINPEVGELDLSPNAEPPFDKWEALQSIEPNVKKSWNHERKDLQDQSASAYDMSLATYAAMADWTDNEIARLLIAHRRNNNEDLKLRQDYYRRTIKKARKFCAKEKSKEKLDEIVDKAEEEGENGKVKKEILSHISNLFGIKIKRFVKYTSDPPQYRLETTKGNTMVGSGKAVLRQNTFRSKVFEATNTVIPKFKSDKWDNIIQALGNAVIEESLGEEATDEGTARTWISNYLNERTVMDFVDEENAGEIAELQSPFRQEGSVYIFGDDFRRWLKISQMEKISAKQMGAILRSYNCSPEKINIMMDGKRTTRGVWKLPDSEFNDE